MHIYFSNENDVYSYYYAENNVGYIYINSVVSLMHEYVHSLTVSVAKQSLWVREGLATYYRHHYCYYSRDFLNNDWNNVPASAKYNAVRQYIEKIARPIDMKTDYKELDNILVYSLNLYDNFENYTAASSFFQYLVNTYGETRAINYYCEKNGQYDQLDKSFEQLCADWKTYIETNYNEYYRYAE